jgi:hypothetical protein
MSYIGNQPTSVAFLTDQFSGTGSQTAYTLSAAPANTASILVAVSGVLQDPSTYSTSGLTLTFSAAPPSGTGNISVRYLGIPASNIATTAYRTVTDFTATAGQTTFSVPSYTAGFINVYRNGARLGAADYTATNGTTVVLATGATSGDLVTTESFFVSSVLNAIPATNGAVTTPYILDGAVTAAKMGANGTWAPTGTVIQVVQGTSTSSASTTSTSFVTTGVSASITPKLSTSKIAIFITGQLYSSGTAIQSYLTIYRGATELSGNGASGNGFAPNAYNAAGAITAGATLNYLDSPATTSSTTYTIYLRTSSGTSYFNSASGTSTILLMEIAG